MADGTSSWRYLVYAMPLVTAAEFVLAVALLGMIATSGVPLVDLLVPAIPFVLAALVVRLLLPVAVLSDARAVREATGGAFDGEKYAMWTVPGILLPVVDSGIALLYLRASRRALTDHVR